jgi:hypothetical protein
MQAKQPGPAPLSLLWWFLQLPVVIKLTILSGIAGAWLFNTLLPVLFFLPFIALGILGFILNAPLPTPIQRATGADRRQRRR